MPAYTIVAAVMVMVTAAPVGVNVQPARFPTCHHDAQSSPTHRERRRQAIEMARAVHEAQNRMLVTSRRYASMPDLDQALPTPPDGFRLKVYASEDGYIASLKDTTDPCHYGIFVDESGQVYEHTPDVPKVAR